MYSLANLLIHFIIIRQWNLLEVLRIIFVYRVYCYSTSFTSASALSLYSSTILWYSAFCVSYSDCVKASVCFSWLHRVRYSSNSCSCLWYRSLYVLEISSVTWVRIISNLCGVITYKNQGTVLLESINEKNQKTTFINNRSAFIKSQEHEFSSHMWMMVFTALCI